ncbi:MAG: hypothetical protein DRP47_09820 [Candidatus Zixiibacteriota bacterium]|nr:MAG: hypothetical protein DRP47_09820 [candidate division Zixibacteria bacterium]
MKKISVFFVFVVVGMLFVSCQDDYFLEPPSSLAGNYEGIYTIEERTGSNVVVYEQRILWIFTDFTWNLKIDLDNMTDFCICESYGRYNLEDKVRLSIDGSNPEGELCESCNSGYDPVGEFELDRSTGDVILTQLTTADDGKTTMRQLTLKRVSAESTE